jgi:ribosome biogenesis GTPase / thiamine phosphate phosphatase
MTLRDLGWNDDLKAAFAPYAARGWAPARLIRETPINYGAFLGDGEEIDVILCGRVWHEAKCDADLPAVGDWVAVELGDENQDHVIRAMLPRRTCFSRKMPGNSSEAQVIGANVDIVAVVTDAGPDFNLRRMERYFTLIGKSGATAVVLVNKADLFPAEQNQRAADEIAALWSDAHVHITSAVKGEGLKVLKKYLKKGITMCVVGSSGVGKSTLVNQLYGDEWQWTGEVNEVTGKGRHTTTSRELVPIESGGMLIDNPGMREIQMWTDEQTLRESFADVDALTHHCKFADCSHRRDAGCAIREAVEKGELEEARYESFLNLETEIAALRKRAKKRQMAVERWAKRNNRVKARNLNDRIQLEKDERGEV